MATVGVRRLGTEETRRCAGLTEVGSEALALLTLALLPTFEEGRQHGATSATLAA
ncbi:MAG TPA: hypothetical protein VGH09_12440 [Solirubrobacteraceae bacterium]